MASGQGTRPPLIPNVSSDLQVTLGPGRPARRLLGRQLVGVVMRDMPGRLMHVRGRVRHAPRAGGHARHARAHENHRESQLRGGIVP